jgi:hypothetical protein
LERLRSMSLRHGLRLAAFCNVRNGSICEVGSLPESGQRLPLPGADVADVR